jgi:NH3-dependent NAD+ synthetase
MMTAYYLSQELPLHRSTRFTPVKEDWPDYTAARKAAIAAYRTDLGDTTTPDEEINFVPYLEDAKENKLYKKLISGSNKPALNPDGSIARNAPLRADNQRKLLVLASSNADEAIRGFFTKYDAASADLNPIGSFSKHDLRQFLLWCITQKFISSDAVNIKYTSPLPNEPSTELPKGNFQVLYKILVVVASPELVPVDIEALKAGKNPIQDDEVAITMTYDDLYEFGMMRRVENLGPISMFLKMCRNYLGKEITEIDEHAPEPKKIVAATPANILRKMKAYFYNYGINRNKMTILPASIHATNYSPDDNRYDQRPFLVPGLEYQLKIVEQLAQKMQLNPKLSDLIETGQSKADTENKKIKAELGKLLPIWAEQAKKIETNLQRRRVLASASRGSASAPASAGNLDLGGTAEDEELGGTAEDEILGGGARPRRNLTHLRRVTRDKKRDAKRRSQTRKS